MSVAAPDEEELAELNRIFGEALLALAKSGARDQASRLAARAWSVLRHRHAREAARLTALLHALVPKSTVQAYQQGDCNHE